MFVQPVGRSVVSPGGSWRDVPTSLKGSVRWHQIDEWRRTRVVRLRVRVRGEASHDIRSQTTSKTSAHRFEFSSEKVSMRKKTRRATENFYSKFQFRRRIKKGKSKRQAENGDDHVQMFVFPTRRRKTNKSSGDDDEVSLPNGATSVARIVPVTRTSRVQTCAVLLHDDLKRFSPFVEQRESVR